MAQVILGLSHAGSNFTILFLTIEPVEPELATLQKKKRLNLFLFAKLDSIPSVAIQGSPHILT